MEPTNDNQRQPPIDNSPEAQQARALSTANAEIYDIAARAAGGAGNRDALIQWAGANLPDDEIRQFNLALSDPDSVGQAIENLVARHAAATRPPAPAGGGHQDPATFAEDNRAFNDGGHQDPALLARIEATDFETIQKRSM